VLVHVYGPAPAGASAQDPERYARLTRVESASAVAAARPRWVRGATVRAAPADQTGSAHAARWARRAQRAGRAWCSASAKACARRLERAMGSAASYVDKQYPPLHACRRGKPGLGGRLGAPGLSGWAAIGRRPGTEGRMSAQAQPAVLTPARGHARCTGHRAQARLGANKHTSPCSARAAALGYQSYPTLPQPYHDEAGARRVPACVHERVHLHRREVGLGVVRREGAEDALAHAHVHPLHLRAAGPR
jgi:hypothetical protein